MKILVTGAAGFVGRHLCGHLETGGHEVIALDSPRGGGARVLDLRDERRVRVLLDDVRPDAVAHLAARTRPGATADMVSLIQDNVAMAFAVLEGALATASNPRVLIVSSSAVYGAVDRARAPIVESEPLRPVLPYGAATVSVEALAALYSAKGLDVLIARPVNLAGSGQSPGTTAAAFAGWTARPQAAGGGTM